MLRLPSNKYCNCLSASLWFSGDGSETSSTDLNTIDGYIYAIPICYVNRRYVSVGSQIQNYALLSTHTGVTKKLIANPNTTTMTIPSGVSDRPDGLFADIFVANDVIGMDSQTLNRFKKNGRACAIILITIIMPCLDNICNCGICW